jgi:hypothetical protein
MMIEKGQIYKEKVEKMREEKQGCELDGCTFTPDINKKVSLLAVKDPAVRKRYKEDQKSDKKVYELLYEKGKPRPRQDRSPLDIDYEKSQGECSFKPKTFTETYKGRQSPKCIPKSMKSPSRMTEVVPVPPGPSKAKML